MYIRWEANNESVSFRDNRENNRCIVVLVLFDKKTNAMAASTVRTERCCACPERGEKDERDLVEMLVTRV